MSRPVVIQKEKLLDAARCVFIRHGYQAGVKVIAAEAGVSEGSLFTHFKTKSDLFTAAMDWHSRMEPRTSDMIKANDAGNIRKTLEALGRQLLERIRSILPGMIMAMSRGTACYKPHNGRGSDRPSPLKSEEYLASYFRAEIKRGQLAMTDPEMKAQIFLGALIRFELLKLFFRYNKTSPQEYVRTVVDTIVGPVIIKDKQRRLGTRRRTYDRNKKHERSQR